MLNSAFGEFGVFNWLWLVLLAGLAVQLWLTKRQVARLEARLAQNQLQLSREIKQVNQGAIGIGRRFAKVEKVLVNKASDTIKTPQENPTTVTSADFAKVAASKFADVQNSVLQQAKAKPAPVAIATKRTSSVRGLTTKAEASLTAWLNEQSA